MPNAKVKIQIIQTFFMFNRLDSLYVQTRKSKTTNKRSVANAELMLLANMPLKVPTGSAYNMMFPDSKDSLATKMLGEIVPIIVRMR